MGKTYAHNFNDFSGWLADNPTLLGKGQFVDAKNMNIRDNYPLLKLSSGVTAVYTSTKETYCGVDNYLFWEDGYVYNTAGTNLATITAANDICWCAKFDGRYIRWENSGATSIMGKIDVTDADNDSNREDEASYDDTWDVASSVSLVGRTDYRLPQSSYWVSTVSFNGNLYFSNANQVLVLDTNEIITQWLTNLPYNIVWLTYYGSRIEVWMENGEILFWDGVQTSWDESINVGEKIYAMGWAAGITYFITGSSGARSVLRRKIWYEIQKVKTGLCDYRTDRGGRCASQAIGVLEGIAYIPWGKATDWIYTYGSSMPWMPESFNYEFGTAATGNDITWIHMVYSYADNIFISYLDSASGKWVNKLFTNGSGYSTGYVTTYALDGGLRTQKKRLSRIEMHWNFSDTNKVVISYRKDKLGLDQYTRTYILTSAPSFTTLIDTDNLTNGSNQRIYGKDIDIEFYDIQFKIAVSWTGTLSDLIVYYEYIAE